MRVAWPTGKRQGTWSSWNCRLRRGRRHESFVFEHCLWYFAFERKYMKYKERSSPLHNDEARACPSPRPSRQKWPFFVVVSYPTIRAPKSNTYSTNNHHLCTRRRTSFSTLFSSFQLKYSGDNYPNSIILNIIKLEQNNPLYVGSLVSSQFMRKYSSPIVLLMRARTGRRLCAS